MERIVKLRAFAVSYDIRDAAQESLTVEELIERLQELPSDAKVVYQMNSNSIYDCLCCNSFEIINVKTKEEDEDERERLMAIKYKQDYTELAEIVRNNTLEQLRELSSVCLLNECEDFVDIEYEDIIGTIWKEEKPYLGEAFDLWTPEYPTEYVGNEELGERVYLKL